MKQAILLHGTGGSNEDYFWFANTKKFLEAHGYQVWWPLLPHTEKPELEETLLYIETNVPAIDHETIIIGHSSACSVILSMLEVSLTKIKQAVLVAGFYQDLHDDGYSLRMLPAGGFDYERAASSADEVVLINSDNDPWGCDDKQARPVAIGLGAKFVLAEGQGHMGSGTYNQPYREFPLLKDLLAV